MKKIFMAILFLVLGILFILGNAYSLKDDNPGQAGPETFNPDGCIQNCNKVQISSYDKCVKEHIFGTSGCSEGKKICLENAKKDFENKKISLKRYIMIKQDCTKRHLGCIKRVNSEKTKCMKKADENNRLCIKNCKELLSCTFLYNPICGDDGKTYGNECLLNSAGVKKACDGKCPCEKICPTVVCDINNCPYGCEFDDTGCITGKCNPKPKICYGNSDCKSNQFCEFDKCPLDILKCLPDKENEKCIITHEKITGKCVEVPKICPLTIAPLIYQPVCGCNGKTYSSECEMNRF